LRANKTLFFVDNYIVALGSNISSTNEIYPVQTTITQLGIGSGKSNSFFNNKIVKGTNANMEVAECNPISYVDAKGHSYIFPKGANLTFARAEQNEPLERGKATKAGNYETCRIIHGINPQSASYQYVIVINGGEKETKNLEQNFDKLFRVDQQDSVAHVVRYLPENITGYAVRKPANMLKSNLIKYVDTPCMFVVQQDKQTCVLSLSNPEFGRTDKFYTFSQVDRENPEIFRAKSKICPLKITLKGVWELQSNTIDAKIIGVQNNETVIEFACFDGKTISIQLIQK
jgi:chondroitin-sulfate-ABC endolyase/exolyase